MIKRFGLALSLLATSAPAWTVSSSGLLGWQKKTLTLHWSSSQCSVSAEVVARAIDGAILAWNKIPNSNLILAREASETAVTVATFLAGTATETPTILCDNNFATNQGADPDSVPALTRLGSHSPLDYGGIILNAEAGGAADISNLSENQLVVVLAHELGHLLGLGHSGNALALMYYDLQGKTEAVLVQDDRDGIAYLYPRNEFEGGTFGCAAVHRREMPTSAALMWVVFFASTFLVPICFRVFAFSSLRK